MEFRYGLTILERHLDTFGHVNNATYLALYEEARWDMIERMGYGLARIQKEMKGPVILELNLSFKRELKNRTKIEITTRFKEMRGEKIMVLDQAMILPDGKVASEMEITIGFMDMKLRKLIVPERDWLAAVGAI